MKHLPAEKVEELALSPGTDPHLASCAECQKAVVAARGRRKLLGGLKDLTLTDAAFRRVEAKLLSEASAPVSVFAQLKASGWVGAALVAVALLVIVPQVLEKQRTGAPVAVNPPPVVREEAAPQWTAVLVEGAVTRNGSALVAGEVVKKAELVDARMGRVVLVQVGRDVRIELMGMAKVEAALRLEEGSLAVQGVPEVMVEAAGAWVSGTDAAFVVTRAAAVVVVEVLSGEAKVGSDSQLRDAVTVRAPNRLTVPLPARPPFALSDAAPAPYPFPTVPREPWARLDLSDLPAGSSFDVDGHHGGDRMSLMLTEGRHLVRVQVPGQGSRETWIQLVSGTENRFKLPPRNLEPQKDEPPPSEEAIAELQRALKDQRPKLRACYEKWLKANPVATGEVLLTLSVSKKGKVLGARVDEATVPRESVDCLVRTGKRLVLPPLGSEQEIEVPLSFTQGK